MTQRPWHASGSEANATVRALLAAACILGCGPPTPGYDPTVHLRVGADPSAEGADVEAHFVDQGFERAVRAERAGAVALLMRHPDGRRALRIATSRGIVLATDTRAVGLLDPPLPDLDGDGDEDLVVSATDVALDRTCLAIVAVREDGRIEETTARLQTSPRGCVEELRVEGGRAIATVRMRYPELAAGRVPVAERLLLGPAWRTWQDPLATRTRREALGDANDREAHHLAVELAALTAFGGGDEEAQWAAYEDALRHAEADAAPELRARVRDFVRRGCLTGACDAQPSDAEHAAEP